MTDASDKTTDKSGEKPSDKKREASSDSSDTHASSASRAAAKAAAAVKPPKPEATKTKPAPKSRPKARPRGAKKSGSGYVWLVLLVIAGSGAAGWPYVGPKLGAAVETVRTSLGLKAPSSQGLHSKDTALPAPASMMDPAPEPQPRAQTEPRLVAPQPAAPTAAPIKVEHPNLTPAIDNLAMRLSVLEGQLSAVSSSDGTAALAVTSELSQTLSGLNAQLTAIASRLDAIEQTQSTAARVGPAISTQTLVLATTQLRTRLMGGQSFAAELAALDHIGAQDPVVRAEIDRLRPYAEVGVPSKADLIAGFAPVATSIIRANGMSGEQGWLGAIKDSLSGLITVRRTDPSKINNVIERAVAEAEAAMQLGDLQGAARALTPLQGLPGDAAGAWLGEAYARVDADLALEALHTHALEALAQASGG